MLVRNVYAFGRPLKLWIITTKTREDLIHLKLIDDLKKDRSGWRAKNQVVDTNNVRVVIWWWGPQPLWYFRPQPHILTKCGECPKLVNSVLKKRKKQHTHLTVLTIIETWHFFMINKSRCGYNNWDITIYQAKKTVTYALPKWWKSRHTWRTST